MDDQVIEKKVYKGEPTKLSTGKRFRIIQESPRPIEILSSTDDGIENQDLRILVQSDDGFKRYFYQEEGVELTPATPLAKNKKFSVIIPQSASEPIFNFLPPDYRTEQMLRFPLKPFIDTNNTDPVKMFVFQPKVHGDCDNLVMDGDTSYLNGLDFRPVGDDDESLLFSQQLETTVNAPDGAIEIDKLDEDTCKQIMTHIIGDDYERQFDETKVPPGEKDEFWTVKRGVSTTATTGKALWNHRRVLQDFGFKGKFYIKTVKGKQYVIFRGYRGLRKWYTGTRYRATNPKVISLSSAGKLKSGLKGNAITILIVGAIDVADWIMSDDADKQFEDLCVTLGMSILKTVISSIIAAGIAGLILAGVAAVGFTAPVWIVIVGTISLGIGIGMALDWVDNKTGTSEYMKCKGHEAGSFIEDAWQENVIEPLGRMFYQLEMSIANMYLRRMMIGY